MPLRNKIKELFNYRGIPQLIEGEETDRNVRNAFIEKLIDIQAHIYNLDAVLESEWHILERDLELSWNKIFSSLSAIGLSQDLHHDYCRHIFKYQNHELGQRQGKSILRFKMEYFYFYKSCDVKLIRRLVYEKYPSLNKIGSLSDWRWFDLVTEVNDDIDDFFEDIDTNNGNGFLLSIQQHGLDIAHNIFKDFLREVELTFLSKRSKISANSLISKMTSKVILDTLNLLDHRAGEIKGQEIRNSISASQFSEYI